MEDHHDDCGEDLSSLTEEQGTALCCPCGTDSDDLSTELDHMLQAYPIDLSKVAHAQPGGVPSGQDPRAPAAFRDCLCPGCRGTKPIDDWLHNRKIRGMQIPLQRTYYS